MTKLDLLYLFKKRKYIYPPCSIQNRVRSMNECIYTKFSQSFSFFVSLRRERHTERARYTRAKLARALLIHRARCGAHRPILLLRSLARRLAASKKKRCGEKKKPHGTGGTHDRIEKVEDFFPSPALRFSRDLLSCSSLCTTVFSCSLGGVELVVFC